VTLSNGEHARVHVRLLATPERIKREVTGESNSELGLLRALWRGVGAALQTGAVVDLDGLPPGLGGSSASVPLLDALQDRQFLVWERLGNGLYLADLKAPLSKFKIDWTVIDRRRAADLAKLQAVQKYAYTKECRRGFVLRYFGDPAAKRKCEGCDNCLGITAAATVEDRAPRRVRRDKATRRATTHTVDAARSADVADDVSLGVADERLLGVLRTVRSTIAREEHVPAYIVFSDRTLAELAVRRPRSLTAFQDVRGVGPMKLERYGARFLDAISKADDIEAA
jgi:ATP-dependent DNA helicase RecQ